jgi:hypothetical protein
VPKDKRYVDGSSEVDDRPTKRDLAGCDKRVGICACGAKVKGVTSFHQSYGERIMGRYRVVIYHTYGIAKLDPHYEDYWQSTHPDAYTWWTAGANRPLRYAGGELLIRGVPPDEWEI